MSKSRHTEVQMIGVLKQMEAGRKTQASQCFANLNSYRKRGVLEQEAAFSKI